MNGRVLMSFLGPILQMKFLEGYRSQVLGVLYFSVVLAQGFGLLDNYWDAAEMVKAGLFGAMPATMTAKLNKILRSSEQAAKNTGGG